MKEANKGVVNIPDFDSIVMKELLRFIYYNDVEDLTSVAHKLIYAAEKYQLEELKELCIDEIIKTLTIDNVLKSILITKRMMDTKNLFSECVSLIAV